MLLLLLLFCNDCHTLSSASVTKPVLLLLSLFGPQKPIWFFFFFLCESLSVSLSLSLSLLSLVWCYLLLSFMVLVLLVGFGFLLLIRETLNQWNESTLANPQNLLAFFFSLCDWERERVNILIHSLSLSFSAGFFVSLVSFYLFVFSLSLSLSSLFFYPSILDYTVVLYFSVHSLSLSLSLSLK